MTTQEAAPWAPAGRPDLARFVPQERRVAPLVLWLGCLAGALLLLMWIGDVLTAPDLTAPSTWGEWVRSRGTAEATIAVLRIVALGLAWYLVGVTAVSVLAHGARAARMVRVADALSVGPVRTVVQQALGVGLAVSVVTWSLPPTALGGDSTHRVEPLVAVPLPDGATSTATDAIDSGDRSHAGGSAPVGSGPSAADDDLSGAAATPPADGINADGPAATAAGAPVDEADAGAEVESGIDAETEARGEGDSDTGERAPGPGPGLVVQPLPEDTAETTARREPDPVAAGRAADPEVDAGDVRVQPGDHLWGLAEQDLRARLGREPSEAEVHSHWERVVALNVDRLVVPSNPDLLRPGQRIALPPVEVDQ